MAKLYDSNMIFNKAPASFSLNRWLDASVTGNGKVGVAVLGAYSSESILINHAGLRWKGYTGVLQDVSDKFPQIRKLYNDAKLFDAERVLTEAFEKKGYKPALDSPLPLAVLSLDFVNEGFITDYARTVDMKSAEVCVDFKAGSTQVSRRLFIGRNNDIIAYNVAKNGPDKINVTLGIGPLAGEGLQNTVTKYEGGFMYFSGRLPGGLDYGIVARVITASGQAEVSTNGISVKNSDNLTVFAKTFVNGLRDTEFKNLKNELSNLKLNYDKMQEQNERIHSKLFQEVTFELSPAEKADEMSALISNANQANLDPNLIERLWNFGKYLAICIGGDLLTPAGLWCGDYQASNANLSFNNAAQLIYGGITASIMPDHILSLFTYLEKRSDDLKKNAARVYGARGFVVPSVFSPDSALFGSTAPGVLNFVGSSALAANLCYSYYLATSDIKTLKSRIFPFMLEVFNFYSDFLKLDSSGYYSTIPSYSPDSTPGNTINGKPLVNFAFAANSTIDFLALTTLLENLIAASKTCDISTDEIPTWKDMLTKIPPFSVTDSGNLREYTNSAFIDRPNNLGCMHSYGLYPFKNFSFSDFSVSLPATGGGSVPPRVTLKKAAANAIISRLSRAGGYQDSASLAMYAVQLAHAGEAGFVKNLLLRLVASCTTNAGLMLTNDWRGSGLTKSGPVSLDISGNMGFSTAIQECIIQSNAGTLKILPTVFAEIVSGVINNVPTDFGARVSVDWNLARAKCIVRIAPKIACKVDVIMNPTFKRCRTKEIIYDSDSYVIQSLTLTPGKLITLEF